jgi:molybdopterin/thiamine biosynthesis adenylyltransferase
MDDSQLLRYARHILLDEIGIDGQEKLLRARVLVVGAGGLGSPAAGYMVSSGVGHVVLADDDKVELSNLQRQLLHTTARVGWPKARSGRQALADINPQVCVEAIEHRLRGDALDDVVARVDLVMDCCDNFATRHDINRACVKFRKPLVSGAAIRFAGQVSVFDLRRNDSPCYHCLFPLTQAVREANCATTGVLAPLVGVIGSMQAVEAIKVLTQTGQTAAGRLLCFDALAAQWNTVRFDKDPACDVCAGH